MRTIFIRYNPDNYKIEGKKAKFPAQKREELLVKWVKKCIQTVPERNLQVLHLFYDEFTENRAEFKDLSMFVESPQPELNKQTKLSKHTLDYFINETIIDAVNIC
jgi:heme oxygenase